VREGQEDGFISDARIVRARLLDDGTVMRVLDDGSLVPFESETDWARVEAMTEEEIEANALSDPDNPPISDTELAGMRWSMNPRAVRGRQNLSQEEFAERFGLSLDDVREWERDRRDPDGVVLALMKVISRHPESVIDALRD
jgi:putative transcriptional regulator